MSRFRLVVYQVNSLSRSSTYGSLSITLYITVSRQALFRASASNHTECKSCAVNWERHLYALFCMVCIVLELVWQFSFPWQNICADVSIWRRIWILVRYEQITILCLTAMEASTTKTGSRPLLNYLDASPRRPLPPSSLIAVRSSRDVFQQMYMLLSRFVSSGNTTCWISILFCTE